MVTEDMKNIVVGPPLERLTDSSLGELLLLLLKTHDNLVLEVDASTGEELPAIILLKRAIKLAKWLKSEGIGVGDSISINSENRLEFCVIPVATFLAGATFAPLNPDYAPLELKHVLGLSKPKIIFCSDRTVDKMAGILPEHPFVRKLVLFGKDQSKRQNVLMYEDIIRGADSEEIDDDYEATPLDPKEAVATILCSSGTTGMPKGVMCTHDNMTACIDSLRVSANELADSVEPNEALIGLVPFFHSFGFMMMFLNLLGGKKIVVMSRFNSKNFLDALVKYRISRLIVPPPILVFLLKHPLVKQYDLSFIKEMRSGAAPMGKDMEAELKKRFNVGKVSQAYGMTETTLGVLLSPYGGGKIGSVGKVVHGMMVKVIDEKGRALGPYQEGELCCKGPLIMKGYVGDPESTRNTIDQEGWIHTGDIAYYDEDEYFFIVDRLKELIKYKAFQVAPAELEALLLTHPSIQDSAVIGLPNEDVGELPLAFVVKKPGKDITEKEVEKFIADRVSHQKQLRGGVIFVEEILRNATGKILRRVLKQRAIKMRSKL